MSYSPFQESKKIIGAAAMSTLHSVPVLLVPGIAGCLIDLNSVYFRYLHGATPYNPAAGDGIYVVNGTVPNVLTFEDVTTATGFVDQSVDMSAWTSGLSGQVNSALTATATSYILGKGLYLYQCTGGSVSSGADWTQGNGSLAVFLKYAYVEMP